MTRTIEVKVKNRLEKEHCETHLKPFHEVRGKMPERLKRATLDVVGGVEAKFK